MSGRQPLFLTGAGFGRDARAVAGSVQGTGGYEIDCGYPLLSDLPRICFPDSSPAVPIEEVEGRLSDAIQSGDLDPVDRLWQELLKADFYLAPMLVGVSTSNPYASLIADFPESSYLTFNYDSFLEFGLSGRCSPFMPGQTGRRRG